MFIYSFISEKDDTVVKDDIGLVVEDCTKNESGNKYIRCRVNTCKMSRLKR